MVKLRGAKLGC
jgi:hypothetical protein